MTVIAEVGDIARLPSARKLCAWAGLTPIVRNSDRTVHHGHISKQGSRWVRFVRTEAALQAKRKPPFTRVYAEIAHRRGDRIATIRHRPTTFGSLLSHPQGGERSTNATQWKRSPCRVSSQRFLCLKHGRFHD
jgi:hypothetical protein